MTVARKGGGPLPSATLIRSLVEAPVHATCRSGRYLATTVTGLRSLALQRSGMPGGSLHPLPATQALLDEAVKVFFQVGRKAFDDVSPAVQFDDLTAMIRHTAATGSPHRSPEAPERVDIEPMEFGGLDGEWMTFASGWHPHDNAPAVERWTDDEANSVVHVALLRHDKSTPRPWVVLIHGAEMGRRRLDARIMRARHFHDELGVNVAMPILPRHGPRGPGMTYVRGDFPRDDFVANIHGFVQAVWDVRRLLAWLRADGADTIGVYGFSLGGNIAAQLAQHESELAAIVAGCPAVDLVGLIRSNLTPTLRRRHADLFDLADEASRIVSPISAASVASHESLMLLAASHDRLADPLNQTSRLWEHWGRPEFEILGRSHVSFMFGDEATNAVAAGMRRRGVAA